MKTSNSDPCEKKIKLSPSSNNRNYHCSFSIQMKRHILDDLIYCHPDRRAMRRKSIKNITINSNMLKLMNVIIRFGSRDDVFRYLEYEKFTTETNLDSDNINKVLILCLENNLISISQDIHFDVITLTSTGERICELENLAQKMREIPSSGAQRFLIERSSSATSSALDLFDVKIPKAPSED